jgi:hypothetical protein
MPITTKQMVEHYSHIGYSGKTQTPELRGLCVIGVNVTVNWREIISIMLGFHDYMVRKGKFCRPDRHSMWISVAGSCLSPLQPFRVPAHGYTLNKIILVQTQTSCTLYDIFFPNLISYDQRSIQRSF